MILVYQQSEVGNIMSYLTAFVIFDDHCLSIVTIVTVFVIFDHCLSIILRCFCDL